MRKLIVFGNGLGMAIQPDFFTLEKAMTTIWDESPCLTAEAKKLITLCLPPEIEKPSCENHLQYLYDAISSCQTLREFEEKRPELHADFLSDEGKNFFGSIKAYITQVASFFFFHDQKLPETFVDPLVNFIRASNSHVATLNYDELLYEPFIARRLLNGYHGTLVDGIWNAGFSDEHMNRRPSQSFGWYMHLHGSPLFFDHNNQTIRKWGISELKRMISRGGCPLSDHIVLSHVNHKKIYIDNSAILSAYWKRFHVALEEAESIIVFGYSGGDIHLNDAIKRESTTRNKRVVVIKRVNPTGDNPQDWVDKFGTNTDVMLLENITTFVDWHKL